MSARYRPSITTATSTRPRGAIMRTTFRRAVCATTQANRLLVEEESEKNAPPHVASSPPVAAINYWQICPVNANSLLFSESPKSKHSVKPLERQRYHHHVIMSFCHLFQLLQRVPERYVFLYTRADPLFMDISLFSRPIAKIIEGECAITCYP